MSDEPVRLDLDLDTGVAVLTLDSPPLNIFDLAMRDALIAALAAVADVGELRAVVLRAAGRHFSAGADLSEFGSADSILEARRIRWDRDPWGPLWDLPAVTVAALHGTTVGSGMEMAMLCDIRLAAPDTSLALPETKLGMLPAAGGTQSLTAALGPHSAAPLVLSGRAVDAAEAARRGIVHRVVADVDDEALALARRMASLRPDVVRSARRALHAANDLPLEQGLVLERRLARQVAGAGAGDEEDLAMSKGEEP